MNHQLGGRRGMATLEFVLVLPILMLLLVVIFGFGNTHKARSQAIVKSKNEAWKARYGNLDPDGDADGTDVGQMASGRQGGGEVSPGISRHLHQEPLRVARFLMPASGKANQVHYVLGGAYDHRNISFNDGSPLVPSRRVLHFTGDAVANLFDGLDDLDTLLSRVASSGGGLSSFARMFNRIMRSLEKLKSYVNNIAESAEEFIDSLDPPFLTTIPRLGDLAATVVKESANIAAELGGLAGDVTAFASTLGVSPDTSGLASAPVQGYSTIYNAARRYITSPGKLIDDFEQIGNIVPQVNQLFQYFGRIY